MFYHSCHNEHFEHLLFWKLIYFGIQYVLLKFHVSIVACFVLLFPDNISRGVFAQTFLQNIMVLFISFLLQMMCLISKLVILYKYLFIIIQFSDSKDQLLSIKTIAALQSLLHLVNFFR